MAENYREQNQEEAEGVVDAGGFVNDPGTGMIAEDQETAAAVVEDVVPAQAPVQHDDEEAVAEAEASENVHIDLHEDNGSGMDWAVVVIVLILVIGCLSYAFASAPVKEEQRIIAEKQAALQEALGMGEYEKPYPEAELSEGVAAVVNGEVIEEETINAYVANFRDLYSMDDETWAAWLLGMGYTADQVRDMGISQYVTEAIVRQGIEEYGIEVPESAVNELYDATRSEYATEEEWEEALAAAQQTDERFRKQCWQTAAQTALMEYLGDQWFATPEDEEAELLVAVKQYYPKYSEVESLESIPAEELEPVREMVAFYAQRDAYNEYVNDMVESGAIKMSPMPEDVPYNVNVMLGLFKSLGDQMASAQAQQ